jgi:hypothetical protein
VTGQVIPVNPGIFKCAAHATSRSAKTPVLSPQEARRVLDAIDISDHARFVPIHSAIMRLTPVLATIAANSESRHGRGRCNFG